MLDSGSSIELEQRAERLANRGVQVELDWDRECWQEAADLAVISPGIAPTSRMGRMVRGLDCPVIGELEFGYRHCSCPVLAVTGSNGKTTTVELTVHCLEGAGKKVMGAGNVGTPLCEAARKSAGLDLLVVEVSSFQLEAIDQFAPLEAAFLNLGSDHLDRYASAQEYFQTKLAIFQNMKRGERAIVNLGLLEEELLADQEFFAEMSAVYFSAAGNDDRADYFADDAGRLCRRRDGEVEELVAAEELKIKGHHNLENVLAALALCEGVGVGPDASVPLAKTFAPSAHRQELVAVHNGVKYVNDSKSTNPEALIEALKSCGTDRAEEARVLLIAGGRDKKMDFRRATPYLAKGVKEAYLIGESRQRLAELWGPQVACMMFSSLAAAVDAAIDNAQPGDTVLLSPACASHDMFANYVERGNEFTKAIQRRLEV